MSKKHLLLFMCINQFTFLKLSSIVHTIPSIILLYMDPFNVLVIVLTIYIPGTQTIQCLQCAWCNCDQYEYKVSHYPFKAFMVS